MTGSVVRVLLAVAVGVLPVAVGDLGGAEPTASRVAAVATASGDVPRTAPTAVSPECARTVLRYGSRGYCVTELQFNLDILFALGLAMDGSYGPATTRAVYWFQDRYGLTYDGITGPQTWTTIAWCLERARAGQPY